jgi:diguanylate cyclase
MLVLPAVTGTFLLVNVLCACVALGLGFGAGIWFFGTKVEKRAAAAAKKAPPKKPPAANRATERAAVANRKVAELAQGVASDVGDHTAKMKAISADLAGVDRDASGTNAAVLTAMDKILAANAELQQRLEQAEKQLAAQAAEIKAHESDARTDALTGLSNRRAFDDELKRRLNEFSHKGTAVTLVLLDIDFFKKFNDTHGHQVGDEVLRQVAKTLRKQAREMDLPCRYGGEEFGVILPATDVAGACSVAERIRKAVEEAEITSEGKTLKVTCSLGLSEVRKSDDPAKIIRRADDALYASKKAGRNCGHWSDGENHLPICAPPAVSNAEQVVTQPTAPADPSGTEPVAKPTFIHTLKRRVTESHRFGVPLSLTHLKIEEYDSLSKKYGKATAQQIADAAKPVLEKVLREMDAMAPMENGEFVVMLPGNTQAEAGQMIKRLHLKMSECAVPLEDQEFQVRFRHGIAELQPNETAHELVARARQAVLAAAPVARRVEA